MTQYCRYCNNMICGDVNYCQEKKTFFTLKQIKAPNKCKKFELNRIDALGENKSGYIEQEKPDANYNVEGQISFDFLKS